MKLRIKGVYPKHKALADGRIVTYWYHRKTGARLPDDPESPVFLERVRELNSGKPARPARAAGNRSGACETITPNDGSGADEQPEHRVPERVVAAPAPEPAVVQSPNSSIPERCFKALVARYRISSEFLDLAASTRAEYERHMRYVEPAIGLASVAAFTADHMDRIMSKYPENPALRQAIRRTVSVLLSYAARTLKWIPSNPLLRTDKPRKRREEGQKPFTEPEIARYRETHPYGTRHDGRQASQRHRDPRGPPRDRRCHMDPVHRRSRRHALVLSLACRRARRTSPRTARAPSVPYGRIARSQRHRRPGRVMRRRNRGQMFGA